MAFDSVFIAFLFPDFEILNIASDPSQKFSIILIVCTSVNDNHLWKCILDAVSQIGQDIISSEDQSSSLTTTKLNVISFLFFRPMLGRLMDSKTKELSQGRKMLPN